FGNNALTIRNSTITGNKAATGDGGGIALVNFDGILVVQSCTITSNLAGSPGGHGGGIARASGLGAIALNSSVVSGNININAPDISSSGVVNMLTSAVGSDIGFTETNLGGNLPFFPFSALKLGSLADNGGLTQTEMPALDSPLFNAGS